MCNCIVFKKRNGKKKKKSKVALQKVSLVGNDFPATVLWPFQTHKTLTEAVSFQKVREGTQKTKSF